MEIQGKQVSMMGTIRNYFMPAEPLASVKEELKKLTATDKEELILGIMQVGGEIVYAKA